MLSTVTMLRFGIVIRLSAVVSMVVEQELQVLLKFVLTVCIHQAAALQSRNKR